MNKQEARQYTILKINELKSFLEQQTDIQFNPPVSEDKLFDLEMTYNIMIRDDFKDFLGFTSKMTASQNEVRTFVPDMTINRTFGLPNGNYVIGEIKPLNVVFAINSRGAYSYYINGLKTELEAFGDVLDMMCRYIKRETLDLNIPKSEPAKAEVKKETFLSYYFTPKSFGVYNEQVFHIKNNCMALQKERMSVFGEPMTPKEIEEIENNIKIKIPISYKVWLQNFDYANIYGNTLTVFKPDIEGFYSKVVPADLIVIGTMIGDGEYLCLSKQNGRFVRYFNGVVTQLYDFGCVMTWIDNFLKEHLPYSSDIFPKYIERDELIPQMTFREIYVYLTRVKPYRYLDTAQFWNQRISKFPDVRAKFVSYLKNTASENKEDSVSLSLFDEITLILRSEAVKDFWDKERELVKEGRGSDNWNPDQQMGIMNIFSMEEKTIRSCGGFPVLLDENRVPVRNQGHEVYAEVRAVRSVTDFPEYAADCTNLKLYYIPFEKR